METPQPNYAELIEKAGRLIAGAERAVVFTGAGISTESGIPDFRSPTGFWQRNRPVQYREFVASEEARARVWRIHKDLYLRVVAAQPNAAHLAVAALEKLGKLDCVITQNVDFLHQRSGVPEEKVIELHGTLQWVVCLQCGRRYPRAGLQATLEAGVTVPQCEACGGVLKPATVSFGQPMPPQETAEAIARAKRADVFVVLGSSLVVYPAADMPEHALAAGARLIIVNLTPTPLDRFADVAIHANVAEVLPQIVDVVKRTNTQA